VGFEEGTSILDMIFPSEGRIERNLIQGTNLTITGYANLPMVLNQAISFLYVSPHLYVATMEPSCKIARLHKSQFCSNWCGPHGFCNNRQCVCETGYSPMFEDGIQTGCEPSALNEDILKLEKAIGLAGFFGVSFVLVTMFAAVGWRAWFQRIKAAEATPLVREYSRPL